MRRPLLLAAAAALLATPTVLAFFHGGYDGESRLIAGVGVWVLAAIAAVAAPSPLPKTRPAWLAVAGLAGLLAMTIASLAWAPLHAPAYADAQRVALYLGAFVAGLALLGAARHAVVPALAAGTAVIVLDGLSERLAPWLVTLERTAAAGGRLAAPLGYWNAMGAIAAIGLVLCAGLAGDPARAQRTRTIAAATAPLLGAGLILSFSRGALLATVAGLAVALLARPTPAQLRAALIAVAAAAAAGIVAAALPAVTDLRGARTSQGAVLTAVIVAAAIGAALVQRALIARETDAQRTPRALPRPRLLATATVAAVVLAVGVIVAVEAGRDEPAFGATAQRLGSVQSNRYEYWRVAARTWAGHPLIGAGSSAFAVEWLRERTIAEGARDAHSLPLETAAELGLLGLLALGLFAGGVVAGTVALQRRAPGAGAAAFGGLAAWGVHVCLDWGWEMPSVSLMAVLLAAAVLDAEEAL